MNSKAAARLVLSFTLAFLLMGAALPSFGAPPQPTAKAHLAAAAAAAKKWQADAVLVVVETSTANPDGTAYAWMYLYDSAKAGSQMVAIVNEEGEISTMPSPVTAFSKPLGDFIDSDVAMAAAVAAGMKTNNFGMGMSLKMSDRAEWFMSDMDFGYTIDAVTGKLLEKG
ncbi:MAG: hypothetical protein MUO50_12290 [Longimicrobiales bacterium]|nr:hypothetical protein [Longimicrobiales bacterium]